MSDGESTTVPCPNCGRDMYEEADRCPSCGDYVVPKPVSGNPSWGWVVVGLGLAALAIGTWLVFR